MNKLICVILLLTSLISCSESGEDLGWELKRKQDAAKGELLQELEAVFNLAFIDAEKAEMRLGQITQKMTGTTPVMDNNAEVLSVRNYAVKAIELGRFQRSLQKDMQLIDYTRMDLAAIANKQKKTWGKDIPYVPVVQPKCDIAGLLQYMKYLNGIARKVAEEEKQSSFKNPNMQKKLQGFVQEIVKKVQAKLQSLAKISGQENLLQNSKWAEIEFQFNMGTYQFDEIGASVYQIQFKDGNTFLCDSVMISNYFEPENEWKNPDLNEIIKRGKGDLGATYRAGKELKKKGEFYFGTDYLTLVFHFLDDYDMIISLNYDNELFVSSEKKKIVTLRDAPESSYYPLGSSRTYLSVIKEDKHCGTIKPFDSFMGIYYLQGQKNTTPFGLMKIEE